MQSVIRFILIIGVCFFPLYGEDKAVDVSLQNLLGHPATYNGKKMRVSGVLVVKLELSVIFESKEAQEHWKMDKAIWVDLSKFKISDAEVLKMELQRVTLVGVFEHSKEPVFGTLGGWNNRIKNISNIAVDVGDAKKQQ